MLFCPFYGVTPNKGQEDAGGIAARLRANSGRGCKPEHNRSADLKRIDLIGEFYDVDVLEWSKHQARLLQQRADAAERFSLSMRQNIDVPGLYRQALRLLPEAMDGQPPLPVNPVCEVTLDKMLSDEP